MSLPSPPTNYYPGRMRGVANRLRSTRANPPGRAAAEGLRRETYGAALQQFDDLMAAAAAIGPVSRPLPLYYAVLQAGKAIAAACADRDPPIEGHGLVEDRSTKRANSGERPEWQSDILRFRVRPDKRRPESSVLSPRCSGQRGSLAASNSEHSGRRFLRRTRRRNPALGLRRCGSSRSCSTVAGTSLFERIVAIFICAARCRVTMRNRSSGCLPIIRTPSALASKVEILYCQ